MTDVQYILICMIPQHTLNEWLLKIYLQVFSLITRLVLLFQRQTFQKKVIINYKLVYLGLVHDLSVTLY